MFKWLNDQLSGQYKPHGLIQVVVTASAGVQLLTTVDFLLRVTRGTGIQGGWPVLVLAFATGMAVAIAFDYAYPKGKNPFNQYIINEDTDWLFRVGTATILGIMNLYTGNGAATGFGMDTTHHPIVHWLFAIGYSFLLTWLMLTVIWDKFTFKTQR